MTRRILLLLILFCTFILSAQLSTPGNVPIVVAPGKLGEGPITCTSGVCTGGGVGEGSFTRNSSTGVISPTTPTDSLAIGAMVLVGGGASLPATCTVGQLYFKTAATVGLYECTAPNTWTAPGGSAGPWTDSSGDAVLAANKMFSGSASSNSAFQWQYQPNDVLAAPFTALIEVTDFGGFRKDPSRAAGYNCGQVLNTEQSFCDVIEGLYATGPTGGQLEWYKRFIAANQSTTFRPFGFAIARDGSSSVLTVVAETWNWQAINPTATVGLSAAAGMTLAAGNSSAGILDLRAYGSGETSYLELSPTAGSYQQNTGGDLIFNFRTDGTIKFPKGLSAPSGQHCNLRVDDSGVVSMTGCA